MAWRRIVLGLAAALALSGAAGAQIEWDKKKTLAPIPNPSPVAAAREEIEAGVRRILEQSEVPVKSAGPEGERGVYVVTTEPVVFARGIVARTQLGHYADLSGAARTEFTRGRVTLRITVEPSTPAQSLVSVSGTFEGLPSASTEWTRYPSLGLLEDRFLKLLVSNLEGRVFDDVQPDDALLEVAG